MTAPTLPLLVVDDEFANRDMLSRRLIRRGYAVETAASGQEALDQLTRTAFAAVLLDVQMPEMSGLQALQTIRQTWTSTELPVLMVTAKNRSEDIVAALELGANDYVTKPIDFPVALARLRTHLSLREAESRLRASEERYALAARGANDGLWDWDLATGSVHFSPRWKAIIGCDDAEVGTAPDEWFSRVHAEDLPRVRQDLEAHLAGHTAHFENEHRIRHRAGAFRWVLTRGVVVRDRDGKPTRMAGSQSDITEGKVVDPLTGLPNRMLLNDRLERLIQQQRTHGPAPFAVLFLDLDGFKLVNDSLGHVHGDELLQAAAARLEQSLRSTDSLSRQMPDGSAHSERTLARLGGDEFVILLHNVRDVVDATQVAERLQRVLAKPFTICGRECFVGASIGIAVGPAHYEHPSDILRDADTAMYRAKALGKGRSEIFDPEMRQQVLERLGLDTALRQALERHEFVPFYQPIINLQTGELAGFEALLRWRRPDGVIVPPGDFLSTAEEDGLLVPIGRKFCEDVCRQLQQWLGEHPAAGRLSINVNFAGQQFMEDGLVESLLTVLERSGLEPHHLAVEITESTAIGQIARAAGILQRFRDAGMQVLLDDFGTGYSSLSCLHELPISGLKLDRSFIGSERLRPAILRSIVMLAEQLQLTVTAEGIETEAQCERLRALGCGFAQGYLFSKAVDAATAGSLLRRRDQWLPASSVGSSS